jgi:hypothetical protein
VTVASFSANIEGMEALACYERELEKYCKLNIRWGFFMEALKSYETIKQIRAARGEAEVVPPDILRAHRALALSLITRVRLRQKVSSTPDLKREGVVRGYKFAREVSQQLGDLPAAEEFKTKTREISRLLRWKADITRVKYPFLQANFFLLAIIHGTDPKSIGFGYRHSHKGSHPWERGRSEGWHHVSPEELCLALDLTTEELPLQEFSALFGIFKQWVENLTQQGIHGIYTLTQLGPNWCGEGADILFNLALISPEYIEKYLDELNSISFRERVGVSWTRALYPAIKCIDVLVRSPNPNLPALRNALERFWTLNPPAQLFEVDVTYSHYIDSQEFESYVDALHENSTKPNAAGVDERPTD